MRSIIRIASITIISILLINSSLQGKTLQTSLADKNTPAGGFIMADVEQCSQQIPVTSPDYLGVKFCSGNPNDAVLLSNPYSGSLHVEKMAPYLAGNKAIQDILALRKKARTIKLQTVREQFLKYSKGKLNPSQNKILDFLSRQVEMPLMLLNAMPFHCSDVFNTPCSFQMAAYFQPDYGNDIGAWADTTFVCALGIDNNDPGLSLEGEMKSGILELIICHEIGHCIQMDMMDNAFNKIENIGADSHSTQTISGLGTGYTEGWAEAFEAVYGPMNSKLNPQTAPSLLVPDFVMNRQDPLRRDRYVWEKNKKNGVVKNGLQLLSTEGVVAGIFYDILTSQAITAPFEKCVTVMVKAKSRSFDKFICNYLKLFPEDKKVITRILLENTFYVTMSCEAAPKYKNMYLSRQAFFEKKAPQKEFEKARQEFNTFKENLFQQAMSGADIFANVGPSLWIKGTNTDGGECLRNLNTATEMMLTGFGLEPADAAKVVAAREAKGFFTGNPVEILSSIIGDTGMKAFQAKGLAMAAHDPYKPAPEPAAYVINCKGQTYRLSQQDLQKFSKQKK
ncbi:MAG: hypothetical protein HQM08_15675 [Candidatus Riflebacteria bacterium]|nr:hypothetical protein [Candidatus Riflebacteria bacterium]